MLLIADKQLRLRLQHYLCFTVRKNVFADLFRHPTSPERYVIYTLKKLILLKFMKYILSNIYQVYIFKYTL